MSTKPIPAGTPVEGDMTVALDSRFLNSYVLQGALAERGAEHLIVTIDRVEHHDVLTYENRTKDNDVYLIYFKKSDKPLKLNKGHMKAIFGLHGTVGAGWHGKKIALGIKQEYRPDISSVGPCVRVLNIDPATGKAPEAW